MTLANSEEQTIDLQPSPYLESPKAFHLEMPIYCTFNFSDSATKKKIHEILSNKETIDAYCIYCNKEGVFAKNSHYTENLPAGSWGQTYNGLINIEYHCTRNRFHTYHIYYFKENTSFTKVGQYPSVADFQIPQVEQYRKILSGDDYKDFTRGIGLAAHGVGIGSFVYLRRVFENLIEEAHKEAQSQDLGFQNDKYERFRMNDKIEMISDYLPDFLVENRSLYGILSTGIHELTEVECLRYFETVKIGIEQILDEKISQKDKADKAARARAAIQSVNSSIASK